MKLKDAINETLAGEDLTEFKRNFADKIANLDNEEFIKVFNVIMSISSIEDDDCCCDCDDCDCHDYNDDDCDCFCD